MLCYAGVEKWIKMHLLTLVCEKLNPVIAMFDVEGDLAYSHSSCSSWEFTVNLWTILLPPVTSIVSASLITVHLDEMLPVPLAIPVSVICFY